MKKQLLLNLEDYQRLLSDLKNAQIKASCFEEQPVDFPAMACWIENEIWKMDPYFEWVAAGGYVYKWEFVL